MSGISIGDQKCFLPEFCHWRVTLLSIQSRPLRIVKAEVMKRLLYLRAIANPAYGIAGVEFSRSEIKKLRASNLRVRNTGAHVKSQRDDEIDA